MRKIVISLILLITIACTACDPVPTPPPPPYVAPAQVEGTVHLEGDSVTWNSWYNGGVPHEYVSSAFYCPGSAIDNPGFCTEDIPAMTRVPQLLDQGKVDTLIWALGLNELHFEGWSTRYQLLWTDLLGQKMPATSCIVMVKPHILNVGSSYVTRTPEEMAAIRTWIDEFAATHPNVVTVDWMPILEAHPEYSSSDGVHLVEGTGAAEARDAMYREGLSRCAV
jgi:hypothetical protein